MSLDYTPELRRQHEAYKAIRARLNPAPVVVRPAPVAIVSKSPPVFVRPVEKPVSCESMWRDWLSQQHLSEGFEPIVIEPPIGRICQEVRIQFGVEKTDFLSPRRDQKNVLPRHVAMALCKHLTRKSLPEIGRRMGNRDHTTILHGCRKMQPITDAVAKRLPPDASVTDWVAAMKEQVKITPFARASRKRVIIEQA